MKVSLHINLLQFFELRDTKFVIFFFAGYLPDGREYQTLLDPLRTGRNPEVQILGLSEVRRFQVSLFEGQNFSFSPVCHQGRRIGGEGRSLSLCMSNIWRGKVKKVCPPTHTRRKVFSIVLEGEESREREEKKKKKNTKRGKTMRSGNKNKGRGTKKKSGRTRADTEGTVYEKKKGKRKERKRKKQ